MASGEVYAVVSVVTPASRRSWNALEQTDLFANETAVRLRLIFDLKSGLRAKLVDRSGSMVIIEIDKYRSDWIEWSAVKARIAAKDR